MFLSGILSSAGLSCLLAPLQCSLHIQPVSVSVIQVSGTRSLIMFLEPAACQGFWHLQPHNVPESCNLSWFLRLTRDTGSLSGFLSSAGFWHLQRVRVSGTCSLIGFLTPLRSRFLAPLQPITVSAAPAVFWHPHLPLLFVWRCLLFLSEFL